jgi:hypothetical protein
VHESRQVIHLPPPPLKYGGIPYFSLCTPRNLVFLAIYTHVPALVFSPSLSSPSFGLILHPFSSHLNLCATTFAPLMEPWSHSDVYHLRMECLIKKGLLHMRVRGDRWIVPSNEDELVVPDSYVISFMHFHKHGLESPPTGSSRASSPLWDLALASKSHWDSAYPSLHHALCGVLGDLAPLWTLEVLLCR